MKRLAGHLDDETELGFVFGFWCGSEWMGREFQREMEETCECSRRCADERIDQFTKEMTDKMLGLSAVFCDAFKTVRDLDTLSRIEDAVHAGLARLRAADSGPESRNDARAKE